MRKLDTKVIRSICFNYAVLRTVLVKARSRPDILLLCFFLFHLVTLSGFWDKLKAFSVAFIFRYFYDVAQKITVRNLFLTSYFYQQEIAELSSNLAGIHLDQLFDYSSKIEGKKAKEVIAKFFEELKNVTRQMMKNNQNRFDESSLPYPYFLPAYVTNSASTWYAEWPN